MKALLSPVVALVPIATHAPPQPVNQQVTPITLDVVRVRTMSEKKGALLTDLTKNDFEIVDSKRLQDIVDKHQNTGACISTLL